MTENRKDEDIVDEMLSKVIKNRQKEIPVEKGTTGYKKDISEEDYFRILNLLYGREGNVNAPNLIDISDYYARVYRAIGDYLKEIKGKELPIETYDEYIKKVRKEVEEKMKKLEDKYITIPVKTKDGKTINLKINAKLLLDEITSKFGLVMWDYLAIRLPPPELYLIIIDSMYKLYSHVYYLEAKVATILDYLVSLNDALSNILVKLLLIDKEFEEIISKKYPDLIEIFREAKKELGMMGVDNPEMIVRIIKDMWEDFKYNPDSEFRKIFRDKLKEKLKKGYNDVV